jgi:hypothetical protein
MIDNTDIKKQNGRFLPIEAVRRMSALGDGPSLAL